jgi:RNA polymerase sigma-70 factor (ECF subfamily)
MRTKIVGGSAGEQPSAPSEVDWSAALLGHDRWLRLTVLARVGERQAVDEVMQEVALAAIAAGPVGLDPARVPAWLHRVAVRQALLHRRRAGRRRKLLDRYAERADAGSERDPLEWLLLDERARLVREALERLPARDAEILLMKYAEEASSRVLADRLGLSVPAVEARLHRGRQRLRDELARSTTPLDVATRLS